MIEIMIHLGSPKLLVDKSSVKNGVFYIEGTQFKGKFNPSR